jgi:hypothetical protein
MTTAQTTKKILAGYGFRGSDFKVRKYTYPGIFGQSFAKVTATGSVEMRQARTRVAKRCLAASNVEIVAQYETYLIVNV